jgi:arsenate reductase
VDGDKVKRREDLDRRPSVLFVCTHNSARSQMAEAMTRARHAARLRVASAGTEPRGVHPEAVAAMAELGIDLAHHSSKDIAQALEELGGGVDWVVTVCDSAREICPWVPARRGQLHQSFEDPSSAALVEQPAAFRRVRDELRSWLDDAVVGWLEDE